MSSRSSVSRAHAGPLAAAGLALALLAPACGTPEEVDAEPLLQAPDEPEAEDKRWDRPDYRLTGLVIVNESSLPRRIEITFGDGLFQEPIQLNLRAGERRVIVNFQDNMYQSATSRRDARLINAPRITISEAGFEAEISLRTQSGAVRAPDTMNEIRPILGNLLVQYQVIAPVLRPNGSWSIETARGTSHIVLTPLCERSALWWSPDRSF